jgi:hypothetical protein
MAFSEFKEAKLIKSESTFEQIKMRQNKVLNFPANLFSQNDIHLPFFLTDNSILNSIVLEKNILSEQNV